MTALECPHCHSLVIFPTDLAGKASVCPNCAREIAVPIQPPSDEQLREYLRHISSSDQNQSPREETAPDLPKPSRCDTDEDV